MSKDEMIEDLHEPTQEDPKLEAAITAIRKIYSAYKGKIEKPLSAALYKTWKVVNRNEDHGRKTEK